MSSFLGLELVEHTLYFENGGTGWISCSVLTHCLEFVSFCFSSSLSPLLLPSSLFPCPPLLFCIETWSSDIAQCDLEHMIPLPQSPECCDHSCTTKTHHHCIFKNCLDNSIILPILLVLCSVISSFRQTWTHLEGFIAWYNLDHIFLILLSVSILLSFFFFFLGKEQQWHWVLSHADCLRM